MLKVHDSLVTLTLVALCCALSSGLRGSFFIVVNVKMNVRIRETLFAAIMRQVLRLLAVLVQKYKY
jgi:hypothetical protein